MEGDFIKINEWLLPLSWLYGLGVKMRNQLFELGILKSRSFKTPVISVGNITVGGAGKTPHVEYLIRLLKDQHQVAVLSRGYKRKSKGFILADKDTPMRMIGDEPYQMKQKFPDVTIAVDRNRCHGIDLLTESADEKSADVILLDDAFQHRYVKPGINILLVDYHRLIIYDKLMPAGRLREPVKSKDRADIVIITKCPWNLKPMEFRVITKAMKLYPYQQLFFSTHEYEMPIAVFPEEQGKLGASETLDSLASLKDKNVLLLTGIGSPEQMKHDMEQMTDHVTPLTFSDHHDFKQKDIVAINEAFAALPEPKVIITTEKDATRLAVLEELSSEVKQHLYKLPIYIQIMQDQEELFNQAILGYVRKNSKNSILAKGKDGNKPKGGEQTESKPFKISFR